jgi:hypothetical protein
VLQFLEEQADGTKVVVSAVVSDEKPKTSALTPGTVSIAPAGSALGGYPVIMRMEKTLLSFGVSDLTGDYV